MPYYTQRRYFLLLIKRQSKNIIESIVIVIKGHCKTHKQYYDLLAF